MKIEFVNIKNNGGKMTMIKIMKKLVAVAVMMLFILSIVPVVFADNESAEVKGDVKEDAQVGADTNSVSVDAGASSDVAVGVDGKGKKGMMKEKISELKEKNKEMKEDFKNSKEMMKEQIKESKEMMKEERKQDREELQTERGKYRDEKKHLLDLHAEARSCDKTTDDCKAKKTEVKKGVKQHLANTVDLIDNSLARLKERVTESKILSDADKQSALAQIDELEKKLTAEKDKVVALGDNVTNEELRGAVKELKGLWQDVSKLQRRLVADLVSSQLTHLAEKHKEYGNSLEARIAELQAKGADVTKLQTLLNEFKDEQTQLDKDQAILKEKWAQVDEGKDAQGLWHDAQSDVRDDMHKTQETLRSFLAEYRELKLGLKSEAKSSESVKSDGTFVDGSTASSSDAAVSTTAQ